MADDSEYFRRPHYFWIILIPTALAINFLAWYNVDLLPIGYMGGFGRFLIEQRWFVVASNLFALIAHLVEAIFAFRLASRKRLNFVAKLKWTAQTFVIGYPSLSLLIAYRSHRR